MRPRIKLLSRRAKDVFDNPRVAGAAALFAAIVIVHHYVVTALFVLPPNPMSIASLTYVHGYIDPLFRQQWSLFAPDPIGSAKHFAAQCRLAGQSREHAALKLAHPAVEYEAMQRKYRVGAGSRMQRALTPTAWILPPPDVYTAALEKQAREKDDQRIRRALDKVNLVRENTAVHKAAIMARIASYGCKRKYPGRTITEVKPLLMVSEAPRFTERGRPSVSEPVRVDFAWLPYSDPDQSSAALIAELRALDSQKGAGR